MTEAVFPKDLPESLKRQALVAGTEAAWERAKALEVIAWCREQELAVVGTELWLKAGGAVQQGIQADDGLRAYEHDIEPEDNEPWEAFHARSIREARTAIEGFTWPADACEPEQPVYFYLVIIDELWLQQYRYGQG